MIIIVLEIKPFVNDRIVKRILSILNKSVKKVSGSGFLTNRAGIRPIFSKTN
jgi:hypothetical protein